MLQLDLFEKDTTNLLIHEMEKLKSSNDKLRKALFARHGELAKNYFELINRLEIIERNICKTSNSSFPLS